MRKLFSMAALLLLGSCHPAEADRRQAPTKIGLYTSLPILWREAHDISGYLQAGAEPHWAVAVLDRFGTVVPLDTLAAADGNLPLPPDATLVLAQPRPLSPDENVALDRWVRAGGRVLLFADPMLTGHSQFALGDARRPQDVILLSPILTRWGLELQFDEAQPSGEREATLSDGAIPVNLPGRFGSAGDPGGCAFEAGGLVADCPIGSGRVLAVADAALLESGEGGANGPRAAALTRLLDRFSD